MNANYITLKDGKVVVENVEKAPGGAFGVGSILYKNGEDVKRVRVYLDKRVLNYAAKQGKSIYSVLGRAQDPDGETSDAAFAASYSLWYGKNVKWIVDKSSETPKYNVVVNGEPLADLLRQIPESGLVSKL